MVSTRHEAEVRWDGMFAGATEKVLTGSAEERAWSDRLEKALPVRCTGWRRYLCLPASHIESQVTT